jgi:hypothetical protein
VSSEQRVVSSAELRWPTPTRVFLEKRLQTIENKGREVEKRAQRREEKRLIVLRQRAITTDRMMHR